MCGVIGIIGHQAVNQDLYNGLILLQHRGQDAAGIMTCDGDRLALRKAKGQVRDVFQANHMQRLKGNYGIGHVRYPTAGASSDDEAQPLYVNSPYGIALAHNGNLTNARQLKDELFNSDLRHINTNSDSEILLNVFAHELQKVKQLKPEVGDFFKAISQVYLRCKGAYAAVALVIGYGLVAFRDPNGIRPLVFGEKTLDGKTDYMVASESCALEASGFRVIDDVKPGEAVFIGLDGKIERKICSDKVKHSPCIFEFVYLARPDSTMDNISVYQARRRMGEGLAEKIRREWSTSDIDVVIPIPETSRPIALPLAQSLGLNYQEGFVKNRYIARTFIMPEQANRKRSVRQKLNVVDIEFKDKNVLLVDDSIVRGNTSKEIIQMARDAGAKKVYFVSAAPMVKYPNVYGIDMPSYEELVAYNNDVLGIAKEIGADGLIFQDLPDLIAAVSKGNDSIEQYETSIFDGNYITGDIDKAYFEHLAACRSEA